MDGEGAGRVPRQGRAGAARQGVPLRAWLAPALLVLVALGQIALAHATPLSPWKGGGFGMFSSTDHAGFRILRVTAEGPAGEEWVVRTPPELDRLRRHARELPSEAVLRRLAGEAAREAPEARAIRVEVWRIVFAGEDLRPERRSLGRLRLPVEP